MVFRRIMSVLTITVRRGGGGGAGHIIVGCRCCRNVLPPGDLILRARLRWVRGEPAQNLAGAAGAMGGGRGGRGRSSTRTFCGEDSVEVRDQTKCMFAAVGPHWNQGFVNHINPHTMLSWLPLASISTMQTVFWCTQPK